MAEKAIINGTSALRVITIEAAEKPQAMKFRVAAYARVSSPSEDQKHSFEAQLRYYDTLISGKENWTMVDLYADEGITGTSAERRKDFQRLLSDCRKGKIDRVLTKSVSRFARNTKECLEAIRELKQLGVGIYFEEQKIDTATMSGEMLTTIFAAIAEEESKSISANIRWSIQKRMQAGTFIPPSLPYGYKQENREIIIDPPRAKVVQKIFTDYLAGLGMEDIAKKLSNLQIRPQKWSCRMVSFILQNEKYVGDSLWQKSYRTDTFPSQRCINHGERPSYFAENTHPAIIDRETFRKAQELLNRRKANQSHIRITTDIIPCPVICGICGNRLRRKKIHLQVYLCCRTHDSDNRSCSFHEIPEDEVKKAFLRLYYSLIRQVTGAMEREIAPIPGEVMSLGNIEKRLEEINQQVGVLIAQAADAGDSAGYQGQLKALLDETTALKEKRAFIQEQRGKNAAAFTQLKNAVSVMENASAEITQWDESMIRQLVDTVKVVSREKIIVCLRGRVQIEQEIES